jgi:hypothetical protein
MGGSILAVTKTGSFEARAPDGYIATDEIVHAEAAGTQQILTRQMITMNKVAVEQGDLMIVKEFTCDPSAPVLSQHPDMRQSP